MVKKIPPQKEEFCGLPGGSKSPEYCESFVSKGDSRCSRMEINQLYPSMKFSD